MDQGQRRTNFEKKNPGTLTRRQTIRIPMYNILYIVESKFPRKTYFLYTYRITLQSDHFRTRRNESVARVRVRDVKWRENEIPSFAPPASATPPEKTQCY